MTVISKGQVASSTPFDNSTNGFVAEETQAAIEEVANNVAVSASPGFTWGKSGNVTSGTYLSNDTVPSNITGRIVPVSSGEITTVFVGNEDANTFDITIQKRTGATFVDLVTVSVVAARSGTYALGSPPAVALGDEIAVKVSSGSSKNPVVGLIIKGSV